MAEPETVRSLPALTLMLSPLSRLPFSRVVASLAILWLLLFSGSFFCDRSSLKVDSRSVAVLRVTSCFACRATAPCSLCRALAVAVMLPSCATTVTPSRPLRCCPPHFPQDFFGALTLGFPAAALFAGDAMFAVGGVVKDHILFACRAMALVTAQGTAGDRNVTFTPDHCHAVARAESAAGADFTFGLLFAMAACSALAFVFTVLVLRAGARASLMVTSCALTPIRPSLLSICAPSANRRLPATR